MPSPRASLDLTAALALAAAGVLAALLPADTWLRVALLLPMVLVLPGYAVAAALFLPGTLPSAERAVYAVALSVALTALCGVVVQFVVALDRSVWAIALFLIVATASSVAVWRRGRYGATWSPPPTLRRVDPPSVLAVALAVALAGWSISISSEGAREQRDETQFSELWVLPPGSADGRGEGEMVSIGVANEEGDVTSYRVRVTHGGDPLADWRVRLADGRDWESALPSPPISPAEPLEVALFRDGEVYRRAFLRARDLAS